MQFYFTVNVPYLDIYRMRLARDCGEDFTFKYSQKDYQSSCPKAAGLYDRWTNSKKGIQQSPNLNLLGDYVNSAGVQSPGPA